MCKAGQGGGKQGKFKYFTCLPGQKDYHVNATGACETCGVAWKGGEVA